MKQNADSVSGGGVRLAVERRWGKVAVDELFNSRRQAASSSCASTSRAKAWPPFASARSRASRTTGEAGSRSYASSTSDHVVAGFIVVVSVVVFERCGALAIWTDRVLRSELGKLRRGAVGTEGGTVHAAGAVAVEQAVAGTAGAATKTPPHVVDIGVEADAPLDGGVGERENPAIGRRGIERGAACVNEYSLAPNSSNTWSNEALSLHEKSGLEFIGLQSGTICRFPGPERDRPVVAPREHLERRGRERAPRTAPGIAGHALSHPRGAT